MLKLIVKHEDLSFYMREIVKGKILDNLDCSNVLIESTLDSVNFDEYTDKVLSELDKLGYISQCFGLCTISKSTYTDKINLLLEDVDDEMDDEVDYLEINVEIPCIEDVIEEYASVIFRRIKINDVIKKWNDKFTKEKYIE